jgi:hypothetical protein
MAAAREGLELTNEGFGVAFFIFWLFVIVSLGLMLVAEGLDYGMVWRGCEPTRARMHQDY